MKGPHFMDALAEALIIELRTLDAQDQALAELALLASALRDHADIRDKLIHATQPLAKRVQLLEAATHEHIQPPVQRAVLVLLREHALNQLEKFIDRFKSVRRRLELARDVTVTVAAPLSQAETKRLRETLEKKWGLSVALTEQIDPTVIGGMRLSAGDWHYDATVKGRLKRLEKRLKNAYA